MTTVEEVWRHYEETHLQATVCPDANRAYWKRLGILGQLDAGSLSPQEVDRYIAHRSGASVGTVNRELALLRAALRQAERHGLIEKAPFIKALPKPPPKQRALSREEASALIRAAKKCSWRDQVYIRLALGTGQRTGAILDLTWPAVDLKNGILDFRRWSDDKASRMKRRAVVPINKMTYAAILLADANKNGQHVLHYEGNRMRSPREIVARLARIAGINDVTPHVLRHTVASILLQEDEDILKVSRLLGHASTVITQQVYFQHPPGWLKKTTSKLEF